MIDFTRISSVNPLVWVAMVLIAILAFGAKKLVVLMKLPEEKQMKYVVILKSAAFVLLAVLFILLIITMK